MNRAMELTSIDGGILYLVDISYFYGYGVSVGIEGCKPVDLTTENAERLYKALGELLESQKGETDEQR